MLVIGGFLGGVWVARGGSGGVAVHRAVYPRLKASLPRHLGGLIATLLASPQKLYGVVDVATSSRVSGSA